MRADIVRWGLLSTANINRAVIPAIRASSRGRLVAVASRDKKKADEYAKKWEIPIAFNSYEAMLTSGEVDAVYIGLPNHLHAEWSIRAMEAGIHVLCEKPFAISLAEVDHMIDAHQRTGKILAEAFMYRHHPQTKKVGEIVASGVLGEIAIVRGTFDFAFRSRENIRLVPEWGGGCMWDVGVYPLSFAQYIFGQAPDWVSATQYLGPSGVDETFSGLLHYPGGGIAQISASFRTPFHTFIEIVGTQGRLFLNRPFTRIDEGGKIFLYKGDSNEVQEINFPEEYLYQGEIEDMHDAILDGKMPLISLQETRNHVKTTLALYAAAQTLKPIYLGQFQE